ncbi:MAG: asparagine synthase (glutamine-hydrolyzing) [bacterium]
MCGIAGIFNIDGKPLKNADIARKMAGKLVHRGPDEDGEMLDGPVAFGFRRLRIIDLKAGKQPISNEDGNIWVVLNGEIYNYIEVRKMLQKKEHIFKTQSDTEVIVHAYESFGLDFVNHLRGMFAIAIWDSKKRSLILVRDRIGKKPLFYSIQDGQLAFASEVKALLEWPNFKKNINAEAFHDYLSFLYIPGPSSIFENVKKLEPANMLVIDTKTGISRIHRYWNIYPNPDTAKSISYYSEGLKDVLADAVRIRLRSDVPLGGFLSGGIDSSIIVGLMAGEISPVHTFCIGFSDARFDESHFAQQTADVYGTKHRMEMVDSDNFTPDDLIKMVYYIDEPFGDSSFIPTYWVARMARNYVTVVLSGDGGDELFGGYTRYRYFKYLSCLSNVPGPIKWPVRGLMKLLDKSYFSFIPLFAQINRQVIKALEYSCLTDNNKMIALLCYFNENEKKMLYSKNWTSQIKDYSSVLRLLEKMEMLEKIKDPLDKIMTDDLNRTLVDDLLVKMDRASMACSLEVRSPFLDHKVVEFAMNIPSAYKLKNGCHKLILKHTYSDLLPKTILKRRKQGFEVPFGYWFRQKKWKEFLMELLSEDKIKRDNIFNVKEITILRDLLVKNPDAKNLSQSTLQLWHRIWAIIVFQIWKAQFLDINH